MLFIYCVTKRITSGLRVCINISSVNMGVTFSSSNNLCCCGFAWGSSSNDPDEEALLRSQQYGYNATNNGANGSYDAVQEQMREHERRLQARDRELRGIVTSTNDKLIDISMISNSGIVVQKSDLYTEDMDEDEDEENGDFNATNSVMQQQGMGSDAVDDPSSHSHNHRSEASAESDTATHFTISTEDEVTPEMKQTLKEIHESIMCQLTKQISIEAPQDLIVSF